MDPLVPHLSFDSHDSVLRQSARLNHRDPFGGEISKDFLRTDVRSCENEPLMTFKLRRRRICLQLQVKGTFSTMTNICLHGQRSLGFQDSETSFNKTLNLIPNTGQTFAPKLLCLESCYLSDLERSSTHLVVLRQLSDLLHVTFVSNNDERLQDGVISILVTLANNPNSLN